MPVIRPLPEVERDEETLRVQLESLSDGERLVFYERAQQAFKDPDTYATLSYLWVSGLHHFYLKRWQRGLADVGVNLLALGLVIAGIAFSSWILGLSGVGLWVVCSALELRFLFKSQSVVRDYNLVQQRAILESLRWQG